MLAQGGGAAEHHSSVGCAAVRHPPLQHKEDRNLHGELCAAAVKSIARGGAADGFEVHGVLSSRHSYITFRAVHPP